MANFFAAIDIGTRKIVVLFGEEKAGRISVFGHAVTESAGVKNGEIVDVAQATIAIQTALKLIDENCNTQALRIICNVTDLDVTTLNQNREFPVSGALIDEQDVISATQHASAVLSADNIRVIDTTLRYLTLNDAPNKVNNPVGLQASLLKAHMHIVMASNRVLNPLEKSIHANNLAVESVVLSSVAGGEVCLHQDEKDNGVCFVDIGAGVSSLSVFIHGAIAYSAVYPCAGNHVDQCIADAFATTSEEAQRLKIEHGYAQLHLAGEDVLVKFTQTDSVESRYLSLHELTTVIAGAYLQIYALIKQDLKTQKLDKVLKSGFVLTGGSVLLQGCDDLWLKYFKTRTKIAKIDTNKVVAKPMILDNPIYTCALGLLNFHGGITSPVTLQSNKQGDFFDKAKSLLKELKGY